MVPGGVTTAWERPVAFWALVWLVGTAVLVACGGELAGPARPTPVPDEPGISAEPPPIPGTNGGTAPTLTIGRASGPTPTADPESATPLHPTTVGTREPEAPPTSEPTPTPTHSPSPTPTTLPSATAIPTATPVPTPTPGPTATPSPTPVPVPPVGGVDNSITQRDEEYHFVIELPDNWSEECTGRYASESPWGRLLITSQYLASGFTLNQFSQLVLHNPEQD